MFKSNAISIDDGIIDFWSEPRATRTKVEMLVHPDLLELIESAFGRENIPLNITQQDFQVRKTLSVVFYAHYCSFEMQL